jgi:type I restriction enzyme S subunit
MRDAWSRTKLQDVCEQIIDGKHGDCENQPDSGFYFLSAKDIRDGCLKYDGARQITERDFVNTLTGRDSNLSTSCLRIVEP